MFVAVKGYYDGDRVIVDENINMSVGQEVMITILDGKRNLSPKLELGKYMGRGEKMFSVDAQEYVEELRSNDRI